MKQMVDETYVVTAHVLHGSAHAGVTLAEAQVVGGVVLGGFSLGPIPTSTILQVHDVNLMPLDGFSLR